MRKHLYDLIQEYTVPLEEARGRGEIFKLFAAHDGRVVQKWVHYLDLYERHFGSFRDPNFLEIGVESGGSLELWRKYFGPRATIFGIDILPGCARNVDPPNEVRIGSQDDPEFLRRVVCEMGGLDIVLDDGSHVGKDQETSFRTLYPLLREGGVYAIEDLCTSYWRDWKGGYGRKGTGIQLVKRLIDDMHQWWHDEKVMEPNIGGIHIYDSIVFIEKAPSARPQMTWVPTPAKS